MRTTPIPLVGGAYSDESRPWTQQDTCNYLPCRAERSGTRSAEKLKTPPGLRPFVEITPSVPPEWTPVRGIHNCEGRLFAVIGQTLYRITSAEVAIPLGTIPGFTRVSMAHNQISLGNELTVVNGSAGYVYNTVTGVFGRITDAGYPGSATVRFIDSYMVGIEPQGRYAFSSLPADATNFNTLDRFTSEVRPDALVAMAVSNNELVLFSAESAEFFYNSGAAQQPFRTKRISMDKGAAGPHVVAEADNTVFWLGSDGSFYMLEGYAPRRISTRPIEQAINGLDWSKAFAFIWEDAGHTVIYWTFPDGRTWGWDVSQQEWHRRESYGLNRWRVSCMTWWNNRNIAGDFQKGRLWHVDWDYVLEGDQEFVSSRTLAVIHDNQNLVRVPRLELVMDTGQPETVVDTFPAQPGPPTITGNAPTGYVGDVYSYTYTLEDGTPPYTVALTPGSDPLPAGLTISSAGVLSGTPTTVESASFSVRVTDALGLFDDLADTVAVEVGELAPSLTTNTECFDGLPTALVVGASFTSPSGSGNPVVRVSPNGRYAAYSRQGDTGAGKFGIRKWNLGTGAWDDLANPSDMPTVGPQDMAWSHDGLYLACGVFDANPNNVVIYSRSGDVLTKVAQSTLPANNCSYVAWSADDGMLAVGDGGSASGIYVFDVTAGVLSNSRTGNAGVSGLRPAFSPTGSHVACGSGTAGLFVFSISTGSLTLADSDTTQDAWSLAGVHWNADGIVTVANQGAPGDDFVNTWTFAASTLTLAGNAASQPPTAPSDSAITADGSYVVTAGGGNNAYVYDLATLATPTLVETQAVAATLSTVTWGDV